MYPKTICGWYNKLVRGHPYNEKTAYILDNTLKPNKRFLSTLEERSQRIMPSAETGKKRPSFALLATLKF